MSAQLVNKQDVPSKGRRLALVIGVNESPRSSLAPLKSAIHDAEEMADVLQKHCAFELLEPPLIGAEATSTRVKSSVLNLARIGNDEDFLLFYFSGQGVPKIGEAGTHEVYLATSDFEEKIAELDASFHLSLRWLREILYLRPNAGQVLIILDCSYSGHIALSAPDQYLEEIRQSFAYHFGVSGSENNMKGQRLALTSTASYSASFEKDGHGLMTYWLLQALQGLAADALGKNGEVSLQHLFAYLADHMPLEQTPTLSGTTSGRTCILAFFPPNQLTSAGQGVDTNINGNSTITQEAPKTANSSKNISPSPQTPQEISNVPTYMDQPALKDELGRKPLAEALAIRIRKIRDYKTPNSTIGSFTINIHGQWGSGKTSLLNLLKEQLQIGEAPAWIVVEFNAWKHQRLGSPWWWLMNSLVQQGAQQLWHINHWRSIYLRYREYIWRFRSTVWPPYLLALLALALVLWILRLNGFFGLLDINLGKAATGSSKPPIQQVADTTQAISAIIALIITTWGIIFGLSRSLILGSVQFANAFMNSSHDPMRAITDHFNRVVYRIKKPVAIFIDDLDRCQESYVVELLEGIQTLFGQSPVVYVVAADRRWICASFDRIYNTFTGILEEPGRPLGYQFLEKAFQLSTVVPPISPTTQKEYWQYLLQIDQSKRQEKFREATINAEQKLQQLQTEKKILEELERISNTGDLINEQAFRVAAVKRLASPEVEVNTEHALQTFSPLLGANPRAMKRFVNSYGIQRAIATLVGVNIHMKQLALWTIILLRWPLLAEYLENNPEMIELIGKKMSETTPKHLQELFQDRTVYSVLKGYGVGINLDETAIRTCACLQNWDSSMTHDDVPKINLPSTG